MQTQPQFRLRKLIRPGAQIRLTLVFTGLAVFALVIQFVLFTSILSQTLVELPDGFAQHQEAISDAYIRVLLLSALAVLPLTLFLGVMSTFRIVGPVHRIQRFLEEVRRGESPPDCRVRKGDEYQDLCQLVNEVTAPLRRATPSASGVAGAPQGPESLVPQARRTANETAA